MERRRNGDRRSYRPRRKDDPALVRKSSLEDLGRRHDQLRRLAQTLLDEIGEIPIIADRRTTAGRAAEYLRRCLNGD
jgi:hypothetical protein